MGTNIYEIYADTIKYAKHLEALLTLHNVVDDELLKDIRKLYIKPATNVAKDWLEGDNK